MRKTFIILSLFVISGQFYTCDTREEVIMPIATGSWRGELFMQDQVLPFIFRLTYDGNHAIIHLINDSAQLKVDSIQIKGDSVYIPMETSDTQIRAAFGDSTMTGVWTANREGNNFQIPFKARLGRQERFKPAGRPKTDFSTKWEMIFVHNEKDTTRAIGIFEQQGHDLSGTIATTAGNYDDLAGIATGDSLKLSAFDGNHAYLFKGRYKNDTLQGDFWSGKDWHAKFYAVKNEDAELPDHDTLTAH